MLVIKSVVSDGNYPGISIINAFRARVPPSPPIRRLKGLKTLAFPNPAARPTLISTQTSRGIGLAFEPCRTSLRCRPLILAARTSRSYGFRAGRRGQLGLPDAVSLRYAIFSLVETPGLRTPAGPRQPWLQPSPEPRRCTRSEVFAIGKSILDRSSRIDVGALCLRYEGGGHEAAGTCQVENARAEQVRRELINTISRPPVFDAAA